MKIVDYNMPTFNKKVDGMSSVQVDEVVPEYADVSHYAVLVDRKIIAVVGSVSRAINIACEEVDRINHLNNTCCWK